MKERLTHRQQGRIESTITAAIVGFILLLATINELVYWQMATASALGLWLMSKHMGRIKHRKKDADQSMRMAELSKFADFGRISTGLFHDLMAPLSAIVMSLQEIERDTHPDLPDLRNQLERSVMASKRMDQFMTAIKKRIRSDDSRQAFRADDLVREAVGLFRYKAMRENVTVSLSSPQSLEMFGNPLKFSQVIENLLSNAIDAYANPGIYTRRDILISLKKKKARVQIRVEDWGSGIETLVMPKIYNPFFTTKSRDAGTGLGLWITKEIVENEFQGSIRAHSAPGQGTRFDVIMARQKRPSQRGSAKIVLWGE